MIAPALPTQDELRPWLDKLATMQGGALSIVIDFPHNQNFAISGVVLLTAEERKALRRSILAARKKRADVTAEMPQRKGTVHPTKS